VSEREVLEKGETLIMSTVLSVSPTVFGVIKGY
jgi:hypothetical protein